MLIVIAAVDEKGNYGLENGGIPWKTPSSQRGPEFKKLEELTKGGVAIMGRRTHQEISPKLKPSVRIVVSKTLRGRNGTFVEESFRSAFKLAVVLSEGRPIIAVGGSRIWSEALPYANKAFITEIHNTGDRNADSATLSYPALLELEDKTSLREISRRRGHDLKSAIAYSFVEYARA